jgi:nanoRNase/pAp phosphatase (c-di-AMP/oligoRNAs hydrolase)
MASGLALRNVLRRTKTTAIIGAIQGVTRPENLRMVNLLDLHVEPITIASLKEYDRVAMVDVQPHYFGGLIERVDLVIDHSVQVDYYGNGAAFQRNVDLEFERSDRLPGIF